MLMSLRIIYLAALAIEPRPYYRYSYTMAIIIVRAVTTKAWRDPECEQRRFFADRSIETVTLLGYWCQPCETMTFAVCDTAEAEVTEFLLRFNGRAIRRDQPPLPLEMLLMFA
jgi:hypothetical protein